MTFEELKNGMKDLFSSLGAKTSDSNYAVGLFDKTSAEPKGIMDMASLASVLGGLSAQIIENFDYFKLFPLFENSKGIDMDNINKPCVFYGKIIANAPVASGSQWWYVLNIGFGSGYDLIQITVQNQKTDKVYIRRATNNNWVNGSWSVFSGTSL